MKKIKWGIFKSILCFVFIYLQLTIYAQNSVSISTVYSSEMNLTAPFVRGNPIKIVKLNSKWLNYNITTDPSFPSASITVQIGSGAIPNGLKMQLQAGTYQGDGDGGTPLGIITLSNIPQVLIVNIITCNTGIGPNLGHQLTYTFSISDYSVLKSFLSSLEILFTITQTAMKSSENIMIPESRILKKIPVGYKQDIQMFKYVSE